MTGKVVPEVFCPCGKRLQFVSQAPAACSKCKLCGFPAHGWPFCFDTLYVNGLGCSIRCYDVYERFHTYEAVVAQRDMALAWARVQTDTTHAYRESLIILARRDP